VDERLGALMDVGDAPGLAKAIVNEIKATKGPFGADYALKDFSWSSQVE
jgi:hypothetical protein